MISVKLLHAINNNLYILKVNHMYVKNFEVIKAVSDVNLILNTGKIYGLIGPSGCGKTTLSSIISGQLIPSSGLIRLGNSCISYSDNRLERALKVQLVTQNAAVSLNDRRNGWSLLRDVANIEEILNIIEIFDFSMDLLSLPVCMYSGGQKQRLHLMRSWLVKSKLLILDESFSALDNKTKCSISNMFKMQQKNRIILFITHDLYVMTQLCDELIFMSNGQIKERIKNFTEDDIYQTFYKYDEFAKELYDSLEEIKKVKQTKLYRYLVDSVVAEG